MQQPQLYGLEPVPPMVRAAPRPEPSREQYRRSDWEDQGGIDWELWHETGRLRERPDPEFSTTVVCPVVSPDDLIGIPKKLLPAVEPIVRQFPAPLSAEVPAEIARVARMIVYRLRHENHMSVSQPGDVGPPPNWVEGITALSRIFQEEILAARGLRAASHGIYPVNPRNPSGPWRVQPWNPNLGPIGPDGPTGAHEHFCYAPNEEIARAKLAEWWLRHCGADVNVRPDPDSSMAELMGMINDAAAAMRGGVVDDVEDRAPVADDPTYDQRLMAEQLDASATAWADANEMTGSRRARLLRTLG